MAEKRMLCKSVIESDHFMDMPLSAQAIYMHYNMHADDDGFVANPKRIARMLGACDDDVRLLVAKQFLIVFESGIVVVRHWRQHNYIPKDRYKASSYQQELSRLSLNKENVYNLDTECRQSVDKLDTECRQSVDKMDTQIRLDKSRSEEEIVGQMSAKCPNPIIEVIPVESESMEIANYLLSKILLWKPNFRGQVERWAKDIDLAMAIDKRSKQSLLKAIDWIYSPAGDYWKTFILSGAKLREKFDTIEAQAMRPAQRSQRAQREAEAVVQAEALAAAGGIDAMIKQFERDRDRDTKIAGGAA